MLATPAADLKRTLIYDEHVAAGTKSHSMLPIFSLNPPRGDQRELLYRHAFVIEAVSTNILIHDHEHMR